MTSVAGASNKPKSIKDLQTVELQLQLLRSVDAKPNLKTQEKLDVIHAYYVMYKEHD